MKIQEFLDILLMKLKAEGVDFRSVSVHQDSFTEKYIVEITTKEGKVIPIDVLDVYLERESAYVENFTELVAQRFKKVAEAITAASTSVQRFSEIIVLANKNGKLEELPKVVVEEEEVEKFRKIRLGEIK